MQTLKLFIFQLILFINAPICYAIFFALISKKNTPKKYNILVLSKPVFNNDIESIAKISNELSFTFFPRLLLSKICLKYISNFDELNDFNIEVKNFNSHYDNQINSLKSQILDFTLEILKKYSLDNQIDLILDSNNYILSNNSIDITNILLDEINKKKFNISFEKFK